MSNTNISQYITPSDFAPYHIKYKLNGNSLYDDSVCVGWTYTNCSCSDCLNVLNNNKFTLFRNYLLKKFKFKDM